MGSFKVSEDKIKNVSEYFVKFGLEKTAQDFNLKPASVLRYVSSAKSDLGINIEKNKILSKLAEKFSDEELKSILKGSILTPEMNTSVLNFDGEIFTFGYITDTHAGSKFFKKHYLTSFFEECEKQNVECVFHTGDLSEGMSHRPGHIYELTHIGFDAQKEYIIELFKDFKRKLYIIDGNHDRWYIKSNGALIVKDIAKNFPNWEFLGHDDATVIVNGIKVELFHGEDASSYATSYRVQKLIEAMPGGEKPNILLCGHTHKQVYMIDRNIHAISGGALSWQSNWMRSKKIVCHSGFWIVKCCISKGEVKWLEPRWYPIYNKD
jgi:predicted phosphodiesterase